MPTREELLATNAAIQEIIDAGAETRLRAIPGVRHVSVGLKITGDKVTDELCIHVYVTAKRPDDEIDPAERIPPQIDGVRTDVNEIPTARFTIDTTRYRPLKGGCLIGNEIVDLNQSGSGTQKAVGTFGCTATRTSDGSPVLLTNWHVLMKNGARIGERIFQPPSMFIPQLSPSVLPRRPVDDENAIAFIVDAKITEQVDAGIARLDVSSCCRCCGLDFRDEIVGLSVGGRPPSNGIVDKRAAVAGATVYKVGAASGRTVGRVVTTSTPPMQGSQDGQTYTLRGQIDITSQDTGARFSTYGDSGAVVIDDDGYIVGLLFGESGAPPSAHSYANHIDDVCNELGITINRAEAHGTAGARIEPTQLTWPRVMSSSGQELYARARSRLLADPAGIWLWELAEAHREEIVELVNRQRRVSVVWHRVGGPAMFAQALEQIRAGDDETLPHPPAGGTLEDALRRMADALSAHGSEGLRGALLQHAPALVDAARDCATLAEYLARLHPHALAQEPDPPALPAEATSMQRRSS